MKTQISIFLAINCLFQQPVIGQINRGGGDRVANLGDFTASNDYEARSFCSRKGGNIIVKNSSNRYTCYYYQGLKK